MCAAKRHVRFTQKRTSDTRRMRCANASSSGAKQQFHKRNPPKLVRATPPTTSKSRKVTARSRRVISQRQRMISQSQRGIAASPTANRRVTSRSRFQFDVKQRRTEKIIAIERTKSTALSRQFIVAPPMLETRDCTGKIRFSGRAIDVRFGSKADMCSAKGHVRSTPGSGHMQLQIADVRYVPKADITASFDHLVGGRQQGCRDLEAERPGGFEIDDQLEFCGPYGSACRRASRR